MFLGLVRVQSATACPTAEAVSAELRALLGEPSPDSDFSAELSESGAVLSLTLKRSDGTVVAQRKFDGVAPCDVRAIAAAAVIAAWTGELRAGPVPAPRFVPVASMVVDQKSAQHLSPLVFEVGAQFLGALSGASFAPGGLGYAVFTRRKSRWAGRISVFGTGNRTEPLGAGQVAWTRIGAGLGPLVRFAPGRFMIDLHANVIFALLRTEGSGFSQNAATFGFEPGLSAGIQAGVRIGASAPTLGISLTGWPRPEQVRALGVAGLADLPRIEAFFTAGVAFGTF